MPCILRRNTTLYNTSLYNTYNTLHPNALHFIGRVLICVIRLCVCSSPVTGCLLEPREYVPRLIHVSLLNPWYMGGAHDTSNCLSLSSGVDRCYALWTAPSELPTIATVIFSSPGSPQPNCCPSKLAISFATASFATFPLGKKG